MSQVATVRFPDDSDIMMTGTSIMIHDMPGMSQVYDLHSHIILDSYTWNIPGIYHEKTISGECR
jgi:hypothetical protein